MQSPTRLHRHRIAAAVVAIAALGASASSFAGGGEAAVTLSADEAALVSNDAQAGAAFGVGLTREQVRAQLREARANGTLPENGDAGDTAAVLAARDAANAAQGEALMAAYIAEQQRVVALAEAELRRTEIEAAGLQAETYALSEGETLMPEGGAAVDQDATEIRVDVIDLQTSAAPAAPDEVVIVSLDGGDPAEHHAQAMHVRRQLGAMGLPQQRIYVESPDAPAGAETVAAAEGDMDVAAFADSSGSVAADEVVAAAAATDGD
jgi:hypothetical protein